MAKRGANDHDDDETVAIAVGLSFTVDGDSRWVFLLGLS